MKHRSALDDGDQVSTIKAKGLNQTRSGVSLCRLAARARSRPVEGKPGYVGGAGSRNALHPRVVFPLELVVDFASMLRLSPTDGVQHNRQ